MDCSTYVNKKMGAALMLASSSRGAGCYDEGGFLLLFFYDWGLFELGLPSLLFPESIDFLETNANSDMEIE